MARGMSVIDSDEDVEDSPSSAESFDANVWSISSHAMQKSTHPTCIPTNRTILTLTFQKI